MKPWLKKVTKRVYMIRPKTVPPKIRNLVQKINDSKPHIWILSFNSRFSSTKSQKQQKLAKKITHFTNLQYTFAQKISLILRTSTHSILQKLYSRNTAWKLTHFTNVAGSMFLVQKKHFHCTISGCPETTFSKHLETKCLYIPVYFQKKIFVQEM